MPPSKRKGIVEEICLKYNTWFFEILTELDGHRTQLQDYQIDYLLDDNDYTIQNKTRQGGGSLSLAMKKFYKAYRNPGYRCDIVSVNQAEATDKIKYIRNLHDSLPTRWKIPLTIDNALKIGFRSGSKLSEVRSVAASAGVRGGRKDVVFDEAAHIEKFDDLYIAAAPAIIRGGGIDIISTPRGLRGLFSDIWHNAPNNAGRRKFDNFTRHQFGWWDVEFFVKDGNKEEARRVWTEEYQESISHMAEFVDRFGSDRLIPFTEIFPWEMFLQEFCCHFVDESTAFFPFELISRCLLGEPVPDADPTEETLAAWIERPSTNLNDVYMGVDFATGKDGGDATAVEILEKLPDGRYLERYSESLTGRTWSDFDKQLHHIGTIIQLFKPTRVSVDQTALGLPLTQSLQKQNIDVNIEAVTFTNDNKKEMAVNLKVMMEQKKLFMQYKNKPLQGQIHNIQRTVLPGGNLRYHGEPHDDLFWALCLAAKGGQYKPVSIFQIG